jgi:hypothetical protein
MKTKILPVLSEDESKALYRKLVDLIRFEIGTGCWLWDGREKLGYGQVTVRGGGDMGAHRAMWYAKHGDPGALDVLHNCNNKLCINPLHLHIGTHKQNFKEASEAKLLQGQWKTHCKRGHPLSGDNLYRQPKTGFRGCKTCTRERSRRRWHEDPEFRARQIAREKARRAKLREQPGVSG